MSDVSQIDGSAVRLCREAQGWAINDLAARACLSVKQVRQIEEGGLSSFYSESVKLTAARKIAGLLQLSEAQLFGQAPSVPAPPEEESLLFSAQTAPISVATSINDPAPSPVIAQAESSGVHLMRSEALHVLAQPPEIDWSTSASSTQAVNQPEEPEEVTSATSTQPASDSAKEETTPSGNYFLKILVLFLVAIAVAALMRPKPAEPTSATPESSAGQSMIPPVVPATAEPVAPETGTGSAAGVASGQADVKPAVASELSPANTPATNAPASNAATSSATEPAVTPAKAPSER
jgi:transcriptional regulator with XRE-family HTH domain